ncbi:MAG: hypothetical protein NVS2B12_19840 [Ktedonobacteraceae bacterium]
MFRNLQAIEIAEGALLADVAVIFQFIAAFLPIGSGFFHMLTVIAFTVLVLRRGLYVGLMGMCVAIFIISIVIGPHYLSSMLTEGLAGVFLGITMKLRFHHLLLLLLGVISGSFFLYAATFFLTLLSGLSFDDIVRSIHQAYDASIPILNTLANRLGQGAAWRRQIYPQVAVYSAYIFSYWWITLYLLYCVFLAPVVTVIYLVTNSFVRLLGYDVRPFPGGRLGMFMRRVSRRLFKISMKWGWVRKSWIKA